MHYQQSHSACAYTSAFFYFRTRLPTQSNLPDNSSWNDDVKGSAYALKNEEAAMDKQEKDKRKRRKPWEQPIDPRGDPNMPLKAMGMCVANNSHVHTANKTLALVHIVVGGVQFVISSLCVSHKLFLSTTQYYILPCLNESIAP